MDDLGFFDQPFFEDGAIASKAASMETRGRIYVSSAGNEAGNHSLDILVPRKVGTTNGRVDIFLQWDDRFGASGNDYDLYVVTFAEDAVITSSTGPQNGTQDPAETVSVVNPNGVAVRARVWVRRVNAPTGPRTLEMFVLSNAGGTAMRGTSWPRTASSATRP